MKLTKKYKTPHEKYLLTIKRKKIYVVLAQISILLAFLFIWELMTRLKVIDAFFFSSPSRILKMFGQLLGQQIFRHMGITTLECFLGFVISTSLGLLVAIILWWSDTLRRILEPYLVVLNSLPKIALGPILIVWVGAGLKSIVAMAVLICIIVTIISLTNGFISCDKGKILLLQSMGATKLQILFKLVLPHSIPNILSVLKINIGLAWVGTIMGEYLASDAGLGYLIIYGGQVFKLDLVMASTVILCLLTAPMYLTVMLAEKLLMRHR